MFVKHLIHEPYLLDLNPRIRCSFLEILSLCLCSRRQLFHRISFYPYSFKKMSHEAAAGLRQWGSGRAFKIHHQVKPEIRLITALGNLFSLSLSRFHCCLLLHAVRRLLLSFVLSRRVMQVPKIARLARHSRIAGIAKCTHSFPLLSQSSVERWLFHSLSYAVS